MKDNKNISLNETDKKLPFTVPENYFEDFAAKMDEQIGLKKTVTRRKLRPWMYAVAASMIGVALLSQVFLTAIHKTDTAAYADNYDSYVLSQVDENALIDYYLDDK